MLRSNKLAKFFSVFGLLLVLGLFVAPEYAEARRGGRVGRSFGNSRSRTKTKTTRPSTKPRTSAQSLRNQKKPSFGGTRMNSGREYTSKYGTPRKSETRTMKDGAGKQQNYVMNGYGGYGSGLMSGYMMGSITSSMMWMPWHGAYWYSRPYYVNNPDGTIGVYPPTFSWSKLLFSLIVIGIIIFIIKRLLFGSKSRTQENNTSSFS